MVRDNARDTGGTIASGSHRLRRRGCGRSTPPDDQHKGALRGSISQGARRKRMTKTALLLSLSLLVLGGYAGTASPAERTLSPPAYMVPDNTDVNVRDRRGETLMPGDQSESVVDRSLTQRIRQAIMADESLSTTAKNVKIMINQWPRHATGPGPQSTGEREYRGHSSTHRGDNQGG